MSSKTDSDDEQTNEGSESLLRRNENAKGTVTEVDFRSDTTLQDLPIELLARIIIEVVVFEVKDFKLAKTTWKRSCVAVINRLKPVDSQWSSILESKSFTVELHRMLDQMDQDTIGVEILHQSPIQEHPLKSTTLRDEIFMHEMTDAITVYDLNNMAKVKAVIPFPNTMTMDVAACRVSNCVYVLGIDLNIDHLNPLYSVWRLTKDAEHQLSISLWISDIRPGSLLSVPGNGNLIILSNKREGKPALVTIYSANGFLKERITLSSGIYQFRLSANVLEKSNENLVLVSRNDHDELLLTEIAKSGSVVRQYQSTFRFWESAVSFGDRYDRIVISDPSTRIELLDSELNFLNVAGPQFIDNECKTRSHVLLYDRERNEVVGINRHNDHSVLTIFRLTVE